VAPIYKPLTFDASKFSLPLVWVLPVAWPRAAASRGKTPLHKAADKGHYAVVERLLEAKAAVDVENEDGRGLGGGYWWGNLMRPWDGSEVHEDVDGS